MAHYDEEKVITALKALGNTGSPKALKLLRRLLFANFGGRVVTTQIKFSAIQAVRLMADRNPKEVRTPSTIYNTQGTLGCLKSMHT